MQIFGIPGERLCAPEIQQIEHADGKSASGHNDEFCYLDGSSNADVFGTCVPEHPHGPGKRLIDGDVSGPIQRIPQRGLIAEAVGSVLCGGYIGREEDGEASEHRRPVVTADIAGIGRHPVKRISRVHRANSFERDRACISFTCAPSFEYLTSTFSPDWGIRESTCFMCATAESPFSR